MLVLGQVEQGKLPGGKHCSIKGKDSNLHFFNEKSISLLTGTMRTPSRQVDHMILQDHGKGVMRYRCDFQAHMNEDVGRPIDGAPPIRRKEGKVKPEKTVDV